MVVCGGMMIKKAKFFLFSEESKCKKLINKGIAFIYIVLGINAYLLLTLIVLPALHIPVTMPVKLIFGIIVATVVIIATYRYYELPKGVTLYNDYMQFDVHGFRILGIEKNQIQRCRMPVFRKFRSARVSARRNLYSIQKTMVGLIWAVPVSAIYGSQQRFMRKKYSYSMWTILRRL